MGHNLRIKLANKLIMKKIPCTVKKTNDWAIEQIQFHMSLVNIIDRSKPKYCGHIFKKQTTLWKERLCKKDY